ncbi:MAG TPA: hypothetical protein VIM73_11300, partial [Polyangiaceae bacterium]
MSWRKFQPELCTDTLRAFPRGSGGFGPVHQGESAAGVSEKRFEVSSIPGDERDLSSNGNGGNQHVAQTLPLRPGASRPNRGGNVGGLGIERKNNAGSDECLERLELAVKRLSFANCQTIAAQALEDSDGADG